MAEKQMKSRAPAISRLSRRLLGPAEKKKCWVWFPWMGANRHRPETRRRPVWVILAPKLGGAGKSYGQRPR